MTTVPYQFANTPGGASIPLAELDANFSYLASQGGATGPTGPTGPAGAASNVTGPTGPAGSSGMSYTGPTGPQGNSTSIFNYLSNTLIQSGNPGSGNLLWNNLSQIASTSINVSYITSNSTDISIFLNLIQQGQEIVIQDQSNSSNYQRWLINGTPSNVGPGTPTAYWVYPVVLLASGGTGTSNFSNTTSLILAIATSTPGAVGPTGPTGYTGPSGSTPNVSNIAALRSLPFSMSTNVYVQGYTNYGDGGEGYFFPVNTGGPYTDNGGTIIVPGGGTGANAWKRLYSGALNVKWFGARGDLIADDTNSINLAVAAIASKGTIYFPYGQYGITSTINLPQGKVINFTGDAFAYRTTGIVMVSTAVVYAFNYQRAAGSQPSIFEFSNLGIYLNGALKTPGSRAISMRGYGNFIDPPSTYLADSILRVYMCAFEGWDGAIYGALVGNCRIMDCWFNSNNYSMYLQRGASFWDIENCFSYDATFIYAQDTIADVYSNGLTIKTCNNIGAASVNVFIEGYQAVYMYSCGWDLGRGGSAALYFRNCQDVSVLTCYISSDPAYTTTRTGVNFEGTIHFSISDCSIVNNKFGMTVYANAALATSVRGRIDKNEFDGNSFNDIVLYQNVRNVIISNNAFVSNITYSGTNVPIFGNLAGVDYCMCIYNTFRTAPYPILLGSNSTFTPTAANSYAYNYFNVTDFP